MITLLKAKYIITHHNSKQPFIHSGQVVYQNDTIIYVGDDYKGDYDVLIDEPTALVSPGFIDLDALGDIDHTLLFSEIPAQYDQRLEWSQDYFDNARSEEMSVEDEAFKSLYAYVHLIRNGITTAMPITSVICKKSGETYQEIVAAAHHAGQLGLRVYLGPSYLSKKRVIKNNKKALCDLSDDEIAFGHANATTFIEQFDGAYGGLVKGALVPERIELQREQDLIWTRQMADKYDCPVRLHAAQSLYDYNYINKAHGMSPIAYLDSLNFLSKMTLIPHCIATSGNPNLLDKTDFDLKILAKTKASVVHCPVVWARFGSALHSFGRFVRNGVNMTMGTDTFPPDMIENIKLGSYLGKCLDEMRPENDFMALYKASTLGGAGCFRANGFG